MFVIIFSLSSRYISVCTCVSMVVNMLPQTLIDLDLMSAWAGGLGVLDIKA